MEVEGRLMEVGMFKGGEGRKMGDKGGQGGAIKRNRS